MSYGTARVLGFLNLRADVFVQNDASGKVDLLVKPSLACRLMPRRSSQQPRNAAVTRSDDQQQQEIAWDPAYILPGEFVHFVIGSDRWVLVRKSDDAATGKSTDIAYRRALFTLQFTKTGT